MATGTSHLHQRTRIDTLATRTLLTPDPRLENALKNSTAQGLPPITISLLQGQYLAIQCRLIGAKSVLEIGTLGGYLTLWFASTGASVTSIEIDPHHRSVALENCASYVQEGKVEILLGAALSVLPQLVDAGRKFDLVLIDAAWEEQWGYFEYALRLVRAGGCVYVDNVVRELLELEDGGEGDGLLTRVGRVEGMDATLVSTVSGHKGREDEMFDGFLLAVVREG